MPPSQKKTSLLDLMLVMANAISIAQPLAHSHSTVRVCVCVSRKIMPAKKFELKLEEFQKKKKPPRTGPLIAMRRGRRQCCAWSEP
mmetsp:Transcript_3161/g.9225  ORF Transcript_3161/g.9225 Transcript_3161/m.9225 type:complete len:86 (-) Transcript_3161:393-650(-)